VNHAQDHFSVIATQYALGRICYPRELFEFLTRQCRSYDLAWDCATGSGQAAVDLARTFSRVIATDISRNLLALAVPHPTISYREAAAEGAPIESNTVDLITVAQALHWFNPGEFWQEAQRVLKTDGVFAFWGYNWPVVSPGVDEALGRLRQELAPLWPERSAILHQEYRTMAPPFREIESPSFEAAAFWDCDDYLAHLRSWSASRYHREQTGEDLIGTFAPSFKKAWTAEKVRVSWPLIFKVYRKD
jgi:SAM-dependent methyltransferase